MRPLLKLLSIKWFLSVVIPFCHDQADVKYKSKEVPAHTFSSLHSVLHVLAPRLVIKCSNLCFYKLLLCPKVQKL